MSEWKMGYKVVRHEGNRFYSSFAEGQLKTEYKIDEITYAPHPDLPLYVVTKEPTLCEEEKKEMSVLEVLYIPFELESVPYYSNIDEDDATIEKALSYDSSVLIYKGESNFGAPTDFAIAVKPFQLLP